MTVYIDGVLFLNFDFDFLILITTALALKRKIKIFNIILGSFIGSLSTLVLFFNVNSIQLFLIKIYLSIIMNLVVFYYKDFKYTLINIFTFYLVSILLGGFLYMLNIEFSYKHQGLMFYNNGLSVNVIFLFIIAPLILYIYIKLCKYQRKKIKNTYNVSFKIGDRLFNYIGYMDTGNTLTYKNKPVIITNKKIKTRKKRIYVPYTVIGSMGILECFETKVEVESLGSFDVLIGYNENLKINSAEILLNNEMEAEYD